MDAPQGVTAKIGLELRPNKPVPYGFVLQAYIRCSARQVFDTLSEPFSRYANGDRVDCRLSFARLPGCRLGFTRLLGCLRFFVRFGVFPSAI